MVYLYIKKKSGFFSKLFIFLAAANVGNKKKQPKKTSGKPPRRSHHHRVHCRVSGCSYFGSNVKWRLKIHVKRNNIREDGMWT